VPELTRRAERAPIDLAADDHPAPDPGADRQHERVLSAHGGPEAVLGEGRAVGVVVDEHRQVEFRRHQVADRHVDERQVDRGDRDPALAVDSRGDADADGLDAGLRDDPLAKLRFELGEQ
jgi:hypothetical protein